LVNLVEDWEVLEGYAGDKQGYFQVLSNDEASQNHNRQEPGRKWTISPADGSLATADA